MEFRAVRGVVVPCWICGARDSHGADHQRGCPRLPPVSDERLRELAAICAAGWERDELERARNQGAVAA